MSKRKRPDPKSSGGDLNEPHEKKLLDLIRINQGRGATMFELKREKTIPATIVTRLIASLRKKNLIKEVANMNNKGVKHYLAMEFEPCSELTGGEWYTDGALDLSKIEDLKAKCVMILERHRQRVVTLEVLCGYFVKEEKLSVDQTKEILKNLILDNLIMEVKSNGMNEFASTRIGEVCYRLTGKKFGNGEPRAGAFASIPCGVCPHIAICSPDGVISPTTCVYFHKWLDF
jgi:DNA-directed RNA polymerase III subunit RPC6